VKIAYASARKCPRKLDPGEVKRCPYVGPYLVGYYLGCPGCGFRATYGEECGFEEGPAPPKLGDPRPLLSAAHAPTCIGCKKLIKIANETIAVD
jgi:hypothetical protein